MKKLCLLSFLFLAILNTGLLFAQTETFNYKKALTLRRTLSPRILTMDRSTGDVVFGGTDPRESTRPGLTFSWIWGDGTTSEGYFPQRKKYSDVTKNYVARVVAHYSFTESDTVDVRVDFVKGKLTPVALDSKLKVFIPTAPIEFVNYSDPALLSYTDSYFTGLSRTDLEYLMQVGTSIHYDFVNTNVALYNGKFEQFMLRDTIFDGTYGLWFSKPVGLGADENFLNGDIDYAALYLEMGRNIALNFPAGFSYGGRVDGQASAIFSETIARIFQYSAGYEVINNRAKYGLDDQFVARYKNNFSNGVARLTGAYRQYLDDGMPFKTWNDLTISGDETIPTALTLSYKFYEYAEQQGRGYRIPVRRFTDFLSRFNAAWAQRYNASQNTPAADSFRATLMVAALSHAFQTDMREEFRGLKFPISDSDWAFLNPDILEISADVLLLAAQQNSTAKFTITTNMSWSVNSSESWLAVSPSLATGNETVTLTAAANDAFEPRSAVITITANDGSTQTITITQAGDVPLLLVSQQEVFLNYTAESSVGLDVRSSTAWTAVASESWLRIAPVAGNQNGQVTVSATLNPLYESRTATVTFKARGAADQVVQVVQDAPPITGLPGAVGNTELVVFPNPVQDVLTVRGMWPGSHIHIYSADGRRMENAGSVAVKDEISMQHLPPGLYLIQVVQGTRSAAWRVVKN